MATPDDTRQNTARTRTDADSDDTVTLVDLFDQLDRSSFLRTLEQRDDRYRVASDS